MKKTCLVGWCTYFLHLPCMPCVHTLSVAHTLHVRVCTHACTAHTRTLSLFRLLSLTNVHIYIRSYNDIHLQNAQRPQHASESETHRQTVKETERERYRQRDRKRERQERGGEWGQDRNSHFAHQLWFHWVQNEGGGALVSNPLAPAVRRPPAPSRPLPAPACIYTNNMFVYKCRYLYIYEQCICVYMYKYVCIYAYARPYICMYTNKY